MQGIELVHARLGARLTLEQAAALCGKHRTTLRRMETGRARVCAACLRLLRIHAGEMPWPTWHGWRIAVDGLLYAPEDPYHGYAPADLRRAHWNYQLIGELRREVRRAQDQGYLCTRRGRDRRLWGDLVGRVVELAAARTTDQ